MFLSSKLLIGIGFLRFKQSSPNPNCAQSPVPMTKTFFFLVGYVSGPGNGEKADAAFTLLARGWVGALGTIQYK